MTDRKQRKSVGAMFVKLKILVAISFVVISISALPSLAQEAKVVSPNCTFRKAWAADLRSYLAVEGKKPVPITAFFDRSGAKRSIQQYRGRGVVLNFWATWCPPCVKEMPALDRMKAALANQGIDVIAVSEDTKGIEHVEKYYAKLGLKHLEVFMDRDNALMRAAKVRSLPTTLLIDQAGNEIAGVFKDAEWDAPAIIEFVKSCLGVARH